MRPSKSLILPLALLVASVPASAQLDEDILAGVDELAGQETDAPEEASAESEPTPAPSDLVEPKGPLAEKLQSLAAEGNAEAAYHLGMIYHLGTSGADKNPPKAFELFRQSAEAGDPLGAYMLGTYYEGDAGEAVPADPDLAFKYKLAAADAGHALAQHDVAQHYYEQGDTAKTIDYLVASARQGYLPSLKALASLYSGEGKVEKDTVKQFAYVALLQGTSGEEPSKRLQAWRDEMQKTLSEEQLKQAVEIVQGWKVEASEVTHKALSGESAAMKLAGLQPAVELPAADSKEAKEGR